MTYFFFSSSKAMRWQSPLTQSISLLTGWALRFLERRWGSWEWAPLVTKWLKEPKPLKWRFCTTTEIRGKAGCSSMATLFRCCFYMLFVLFTVLSFFTVLFILSGKVPTVVSRWSLISQFIQKESQEGRGEIYLTVLPVSWGSWVLPVTVVTLQWTEERTKLGGLNSYDLGEAGIQAETSHPSKATWQ